MRRRKARHRLATCYNRRPARHGVLGSAARLAFMSLKECSSTGRAPVSKTGGWGFEPLHSCQPALMNAMAKTNAAEFIQQVRQELSRVTWPTRKETMVTTAMVFVMVFIAAAFFFIVDQILSEG